MSLIFYSVPQPALSGNEGTHIRDALKRGNLQTYVLSLEKTACAKVSFTQALKVLSSFAAAKLIIV